MRKKGNEFKVQNSALKRMSMMKILQGGGSIDSWSCGSPKERIIGEEEMYTMNLNISADTGPKIKKTSPNS